MRALGALALAIFVLPAHSSVRDVVARTDDAVVTIHAQTGAGENLGSGVVLDPRGFALTNAHVVADANQLRVILRNGREVPADITTMDQTQDLAVIRLSAANLPTAPVGNANALKAGDEVVAIGAPKGLDHTVTRGIVSSRDREVEGRHFIQTDAALNPGNSGGPLLNEQAQVVGINTMIEADANGVGFAVPINAAYPLLRSAGVAVSASLDNAELPKAAAPAAPLAPTARRRRFPVAALILGVLLGIALDSLIRFLISRRRQRREPPVDITLAPSAPPSEPADDLNIELK